jgi:transposase
MANRQVRRLSEDEMNRGIGMLEAGRSQRHVTHVLGVSQSVVFRMCNRFQMTGYVLQGHAGGRKRSRTRAQDRFIVLQARRQRFSNATTFRNDFQKATGVRVSPQTVRNRLHDAGLRSRRPAICIPLTTPYSRAFAMGAVSCHMDTTVLFTDE